MRNNKGIALVGVIIVMVVLMTLGTAILAVSASENRQARIQEQMIQHHYIARSGADSVASFLIDNPEELDMFIQKTKSGPIVGEVDGRQFEVYVTGTGHEFIIESVAYNSDGLEATRVYLTMTEFNLLDFGVFADHYLFTGQNVTITGNIGTNAPSIVFGNTPINGNITLGPGATPADITAAESKVTTGHTVNNLSAPVVMPRANPADFPVPLPNGTTVVNTDGLLVNGKLVRSLNRINLSGNSEFYVYGGGEVHILVTDSISLGGTSRIRTGANTYLFLYYNNADTIDFRGTPSSNIVLYAPYATVDYRGGGTGTTYGSIIANVFQGPNSAASGITQSSMGAGHLMVHGTGYHRQTWSR